MSVSATTSQAEGAAAQPVDLVEWLRTRGVTVAAVVLILIELWLKGAMLAGGYFRQDDYEILDRARTSGFGWGYVTTVEAGHLFPICKTIAWLQVRIGGLYDWPLAVTVMLVLLAGCSFAMLRMLRTLFGNRPAILIPLGIFLFSPLSLSGGDWWMVSLQFLPLELAMFMAIDAHVRYLRTGRWRNAVMAASWVAVGMLAEDRGAVVPLLLLALTVAFFVARPLDARRYWRAWALYGAVLGAYAAVFFSVLHNSDGQPANPGSVGHVITFGATLIGSGLVPGAFGGPWRWLTGLGYDVAGPPPGLQQLTWAAAMFFVIVTCVWRVRAWRSWAILIGWIAAADIAPVVIGRLGSFPANLLGMQIRYVTEATGVLALCVGLAVLPLTGEQNVYRFHFGALERPARIATAAVICLGAFGSVWSLESLRSIDNSTTATIRSYVATAQTAMDDVAPGTMIVDAAVPKVVMDAGFFWNRALTSQVVGVMAAPSHHPTWVRTPHGLYPNLLILDGQGQLRPVTILGQFSWPAPRQRTGTYAGQSCWNITTADTNIPLLGSIFRYGWTVRVTYTGPASGLMVGFSGNSYAVSLPAGTHVAYIPVAGGGNAINLHLLADTGALCVTGVAVGNLVPDEAGPGVPPVPVAG
jgi:hypothetical protein